MTSSSITASLPVRTDALKVRLVSAVIFMASMGLLLLSAWLSPTANGMGTHRQLGLPECGFLAATGIPCATCGMTTSFALAAHGHVMDAIINQPGGGALAILTAAIAVGSFFSLVTGTSMGPVVKVMARPRVLMGAGIFFALAWFYKIAVVKGIFPGL